jgi:hypothetical protein
MLRRNAVNGPRLLRRLLRRRNWTCPYRGCSGLPSNGILHLPLPRLKSVIAPALTEAQVSYCACPYRGSSQLLRLPLPRLKSVIAPALTEAAQVSYCAARGTSLDSES